MRFDPRLTRIELRARIIHLTGDHDPMPVDELARRRRFNQGGIDRCELL
jgi:hypothetical protein